MKRIPFLILPFLVAAAAVAQPRGEFIDGIVAVIEDDVVLRSELDRRMAEIRRQVESDGGSPPPQRILEEQVLERLITERLQLHRARQLGIAVSDDALNETMGRIARSNDHSLSEFIDAVESQGYDYAEVREDIRRDMIQSQVLQREVLSRIDVTQREIESFLASQEGQAIDDREFHVSHIALRVPGNDSEDIERTRELGESLTRRIESGEDFASLAMEHSRGQQALEGGDLGWRKITQLPALFAERLVAMSPGDVSGPIRTTGSFHIIKLNDVRGDEERALVEQTRARHILLRTNELVDDERAAARLSALREDILGGTEFGAVARRHSEDAGSAINGGDLGWIQQGETARAFEDTMASLEIGEISQPFQTQFGWHIVEVLERRDHDSTDDRRLNLAHRALHERKAEELTEHWLQRLRDEAWIDIRLDG